MNDSSEATGSTAWLAANLPLFVKDCRTLASREIAELAEGIVGSSTDQSTYLAGAERVCETLGLRTGKWKKSLAESALPVIAFVPGSGCMVVYGRGRDGAWLLDGPAGRCKLEEFAKGSLFLANSGVRQRSLRTTANAMFRSVVASHKGIFAWILLASVFANLLAMGASMYSMQVYDRVVPSQAVSTLWVLTIGVLIAAGLEFAIRVSRAALLDRALRAMDTELSFQIFARLLRVRMDQFPASVGSLSSKLRSYENIKSFATSALLFVAVDLPFALFFLVVVMALAGWAALVPLVFFTISLTFGLLLQKRVERLARTGASVSNRKLGLLVETVENAELIKSTGHGWRQQAIWARLCRESAEEDERLRGLTDLATLFAAFLQQVSYVMLVGTGAYLAASASLTTGGIVACSILSSRILAPVGVLPGLMMQWGHARAAMENLEGVFELEEDNHGIAQPLVPERLRGQYQLVDVRFSYRGRSESVGVRSLRIGAGEKVGVVGSIGAGKSTLLKLLAGLYVPQQGRVLLDGLDMQQIARAQLSERLGYLPQDTRLLGGTLRDNLLLGMVGVSDADILTACEKTGLLSLVSSNEKGLDLEIAEGGSGVSGGQRQLIALTRHLLANPDVYLLDEPTASMDEGSEQAMIGVLKRALKPTQTLVIVTHKLAMLELVDRLIVLAPGGIVMDGPRDAVLRSLQAGPQRAQQATQVANGEAA